RLPRLPVAIDDWEGTDVDNDVTAKHTADIQGILQRRYVQRGSGEEIMIALVCGRPGPISVHTPDVCYQGAGFRMAAEPAKHPVALAAAVEPAPFWKASFVKETF